MTAGFSAVESIIAVAIFVLFSLTLYGGFTRVLTALEFERYKSTAAQTANEQFELARNLSYADVGIEFGLPAGRLKATQQLVRNGMTLIATTTVRSIDDPFDGQLGSTTNDLSPADYKLVDVSITCLSCKRSTPLGFTSTIAPKGLETAGNNGALFVRAFDAGGLPVQGANVHIVNASSSLTIDDVTNAQGMLQIVDAPPGTNAYAISVTKAGYSLDQTYPLGSSTNPNPVKLPATVATQTVTAISFAIDKTSTLSVTSQTNSCAFVGNYDFSLRGSKLIGTSPDVYKYPTKNLVTDGSGALSVTSLEWDDYTMAPIDGTYDLAGSIPLSPFSLNPDTTQSLFLIVTPKDPNSVMVTVKDSATGNTVTDATTTLSRGAYSETLFTGRGTQSQTDWSGGGGQMSAVDMTRYYDQDTNIETVGPAGELTLLSVFGAYVPSGVLTSSSFDTGASSNFRQLLWEPASQPASTTVRVQVATANTDTASTTWTYKGPDGTGGTYYDVSGQDISSAHNGDRYLRYKLYLDTASSTITPLVSDVSFTSTSSCVPAGQVYFGGLSSVGGSYSLNVTRDGYVPYSGTVNANVPWQEVIVELVPI
jgi:hypothetical protein